MINIFDFEIEIKMIIEPIIYILIGGNIFHLQNLSS